MTQLLTLFGRMAGRLCRTVALALAVPACAAQAGNPVQLENAKQGTTQWHLTRLNSDQSAIQGYASLASVNRGGSIKLYVSTTSPSYTIDIYRIGWYGGAGARHMLGPLTRSGIAQPIPAAGAYGLIECDWSDPYTLAIPANPADPTDWASGVYLAKLTASNGGWQNFIVFTVRDDNRAPAASYLFQSSVNTWQAYNNWGGKSLYAFNSSGGIPARKVSFNRPYNVDGAGDFLQWEVNMVRFLEREGYDVAYATNVDLHQNGYALVQPHAAFLSVGHDEYWSYQMKAALHDARAHGRHLAFFGADAVYWQVRFEPSTLPAAAPDRTMVGFKEAALTSDPYWLGGDPAQRKLVTTAFRNFPKAPFNLTDGIAQPENGLVGVMYHGSPFDGDIVVSDAASWVFNGTGVANGFHFRGLLGYETDAMFDNGYAPAGIHKLAESPDTWGGSHMTLYTSDAGSVVFAAGTIQWAWGVDDNEPFCGTSRLSAAAQQTTRNILARFAAPPAPAAGAPAYPLAFCGNAQATVNFQPPPGIDPAGITGYTVSSQPAGGIDQNAGSTALSHVVTGLTNGKRYTFTVTAATAGGAGAASSATNSIIPASPPAAPGGVSASAGNAQATVSFGEPDNGGARINGYAVTSQPPGGVDADAGSTALTHTVTGLANGTSYTFTVVASNSMGNSAPSPPSNSVTPATVPNAPGAAVATAGDRQASVSFAAPADNGGSPITGYAVASSPAGGVDSNAGSTALAHVVTGLANGVAYTFTVRAANAVGSSAASAPSNAVTPAGAPIVSTGAAGAIGSSTATLNGMVTANGAAATAAFDYGSGAAYGAAGAAVPSALPASAAASVALTLSGLACNTVYHFRVRAGNSVGSSSGNDRSFATAACGTPGAPVITAATPGRGRATLDFAAPSGDAARGYIATCTPSGGSARSAAGAGSPITVGGLAGGVSYACTVATSGAAGGDAVSDAVPVTPQAAADITSLLLMILQ